MPRYNTIGYSMKFGWLLVGLPLGVRYFGPVGGVMVIAASDVFRYPSVLFGQIRERFAFGTQDLYVTLVMIGLLSIFEWLRWILGLGTSFGSLPIFG